MNPESIMIQTRTALRQDKPLDLTTPHGQRAKENAAILSHEANRYYCWAIGDESQKPWADAADWQRTSALNGVQQIIDKPGTTPAESHEGWMAEKIAAGWVYGPVKDESKKEHHCIVPYAQLPPHQRYKDAIYGAVVREALYCYGRRTVRLTTSTWPEEHSRISAGQPEKGLSTLVAIRRATRIAYRATAAYCAAVGYRIGEWNQEYLQMAELCAVSNGPMEAYDLWRANKWPWVGPEIPLWADLEGYPPTSQRSYMILRTQWAMLFGVVRAVQWIEGIDALPPSSVLDSAWIYTRASVEIPEVDILKGVAEQAMKDIVTKEDSGAVDVLAAAAASASPEEPSNG